jgi:uncharacterized protein
MSALAHALPEQLRLDLPPSSFASLRPDQIARLSRVLRPLPWIDGLATALLISPEEAAPEGWSDYIWSEAGLERLTESRAQEAATLAIGHFAHVAAMLAGEPSEYGPFLADGSDELAAAGQWAAGFRFGIRLDPEPWAPLIEDNDTRRILSLILCLEREEDMSEDDRAQHPLRNHSATRREALRRDAVPLLRAAVLILSHLASAVDSDLADGEPPYVPATPKVGRNAPCPCGSGKKYKKCCAA